MQGNHERPGESWMIFMQENVPANSNVNEMKMNGHSIVDLQE